METTNILFLFEHFVPGLLSLCTQRFRPTKRAAFETKIVLEDSACIALARHGLHDVLNAGPTAKWGRTHQTQAGVEFCCVRHKKGGGSTLCIISRVKDWQNQVLRCFKMPSLAAFTPADVRGLVKLSSTVRGFECHISSYFSARPALRGLKFMPAVPAVQRCNLWVGGSLDALKVAKPWQPSWFSRRRWKVRDRSTISAWTTGRHLSWCDCIIISPTHHLICIICSIMLRIPRIIIIILHWNQIFFHPRFIPFHPLAFQPWWPPQKIVRPGDSWHVTVTSGVRSWWRGFRSFQWLDLNRWKIVGKITMEIPWKSLGKSHLEDAWNGLIFYLKIPERLIIDVFFWFDELGGDIINTDHCEESAFNSERCKYYLGLPKQQNLNISTANAWPISGKGIANGWGLGPDGQRLALMLQAGLCSPWWLRVKTKEDIIEYHMNIHEWYTLM